MNEILILYIQNNQTLTAMSLLQLLHIVHTFFLGQPDRSVMRLQGQVTRDQVGTPFDRLH